MKNSPNILESDPKGDVSKQQLGTTPIDFRYEYFSDKEWEEDVLRPEVGYSDID